MTTFERTYRDLQRLKGMSLHNEILLYKVAPERTEEERRDLWIGSHITAFSPQPKPRWTWKTVGLLVLAFALAVVCYALIAAEMSK